MGQTNGRVVRVLLSRSNFCSQLIPEDAEVSVAEKKRQKKSPTNATDRTDSKLYVHPWQPRIVTHSRSDCWLMSCASFVADYTSDGCRAKTNILKIGGTIKCTPQHSALGFAHDKATIRIIWGETCRFPQTVDYRTRRGTYERYRRCLFGSMIDLHKWNPMLSLRKSRIEPIWIYSFLSGEFPVVAFVWCFFVTSG